MLPSMKSLDMMNKVEEDFSQRTASGGMASLGSVFVMVLLFFSELSGYLKVHVTDHIVVDTTLDEKLPISKSQSDGFVMNF
jgi:hypothetical protein